MPDQEYLPPPAAPAGDAVSVRQAAGIGHAASAVARIHVGSYRRALPVSLERLYENALDWRRLDHVHSASVRSLVCQAAGSWGWRAQLTPVAGAESQVELLLERRLRRWTVRVLSGDRAGLEVWTQVCALEARRLEVVVDFFVAGSDPESAPESARRWAERAARWYDRDVAMMVERQRQLDVRIDGAPSHEAGARTGEDVARTGEDRARTRILGARDALQFPVRFELGGREFVLVEVEAPGQPSGRELAAYPARCPHQLGPLHAGAVAAGAVTCPWHGYRFDVRTGAPLSGQSCRLGPMPRIEIDAGGVVRVRADP